MGLLEDAESKIGFEIPELDAAISMVYEEIESQV